MKDAIIVHGARQHNLKDITVRIPRRAVTVVTGPSGSGKSSLAFDTVYAEGQRRYVESLSAYARQFLERMEKPDVDYIEGISPAVAIEQRNPGRSSRSTVGTSTEISDYLRLLWARIGETACPHCGRILKPDTTGDIAEAIFGHPQGTRFLVTFPLRPSQHVTTQALVESLREQGFLRVVVDGSEAVHLDEVAQREIPLVGRAEVLVVVDRLAVQPDMRGRIVEAAGAAFRHGDGECVVVVGTGAARRIERFTERLECPNDGFRAPHPSPQLFSFNNPRGACPTCNGFGANLTYDEQLIIPDPARTLRDGAIDPWTKPRYEGRRSTLTTFCRDQGIPMDVPWQSLGAAHRELLLHRPTARGYRGIFPFLQDLEAKRYKQYIRVFLRQYQSAVECAECRGTRLRPEALLVRVAGRTIAEVNALPVRALRDWIEGLTLPAFAQQVAVHILREARDRVRFLCEVGLTYVTLDRATRTLSGGEAQRITLANSLGASLIDTLYVLDEPSIGLHPRDLDRLLALLKRLRDGGNTVLVVEHDLEAIRAADHMIELGPGSGENGGRVVFEGPVADAAGSPLTGPYLTGAMAIPVPKRRPVNRGKLVLRGAREHNLQDVEVTIPLGALTVVTGVSGSGKSTLVHDVLYRALEARLTGETSAKRHLGERVGTVQELVGAEALDAVVLVDQEPIGRSPRSNPVTYIKAFDEIRRIFASAPAAKKARLSPYHFSFNVKGGRCERCEGAGALQVEMVFMADVFVPCDDCAGRRFQQRVLDVTVNGRNIHDVLQLTVDQAIRAFPHEDKLGQALWHLQQVGLGYLRLGQSATTLSGGEAQRVKIARELATSSRGMGRRLYLMDEPTTGLHIDDVRKLVGVLDRLVDAGHTVLLIEHNLDVIKLADWIIDMGPDGGDGGGRVVAMGRPEDVVRVDASHTGRFLRPLLGLSR
ncbi:MAG: excinuclease ABC subunit UvrA [Gemmatimonadetes bacterium]|nr:excinuclease ABC subunit UvrA [Gemmatimonadota bacterium]